MLGHSFPDLGTGITNPYANWIFQTIYSFHMGAFFFYSGFVSSRRLFSDELDLSREIKKKLWRIGIPYLLYSAISLLIKILFPGFASEEYDIQNVWQILIGNSPNGTMWFLWVLLVISILYLIMCRCIGASKKKEQICLGVGIVFLILYYVLPSEHIAMEVLRFTIYYALGIVVSRHYDVIKSVIFMNKKVTVVSAVLFVLFNIIKSIPYFITCPLTIILIMAVSCRISKLESSTNKILNELGEYSYDLYLISYFIQRPLRIVVYRMLELPYVAVVLLMFVCGTVITYLICKYIIRKVDWFNRILLGKVWF